MGDTNWTVKEQFEHPKIISRLVNNREKGPYKKHIAEFLDWAVVMYPLVEAMDNRSLREMTNDALSNAGIDDVHYVYAALSERLIHDTTLAYRRSIMLDLTHPMRTILLQAQKNNDVGGGWRTMPYNSPHPKHIKRRLTRTINEVCEFYQT